MSDCCWGIVVGTSAEAIIYSR